MKVSSNINSVPLLRTGLVLVLTCIIALSLNGCGKKRSIKRDGPPPKHLIPNIHKIPDAVPKVEPIHGSKGNRFGKSNTYKVKNKRYTVLKTSKGYVARGHASWYGTLFHKRKTSSGEPYDMFKMTAAHPTLPIPTFVRVTNLENGKSVIVKINDRGPFRCKRLIDLSYVAAAKLDILGRGTGHVEVRSVDPRDHGMHAAKKLLAKNNEPAPKSKKQKVLAQNAQKMYLQFGDFQQKTKADELVRKIGKLSKAPIQITQSKKSKSPTFLVHIGPLRDHEAIKLTQQLASSKLPSPTVITK